MSRKRGFTLVELLVVIAIIAVLMGILMPGMAMVKELAKRSVCLSNLKQMQLAWGLYAGNNDEKIVNGEAFFTNNESEKGTNSTRNGEPYWTGDDTGNMTGTVQLPKELQMSAIRAGAIYPYVKSDDIYRCPTGFPGEQRTYSIVDSMNGRRRTGTGTSIFGTNGKQTLITNRLDIKDAANRMVFIDEGMATGDSYAVYWSQARWWDYAACRHSDGNTFSFADGHSDYWKWMGQETIENGNLLEPQFQMEPTTEEGKRDLYQLQEAVWGSVNYEPEF